MSDLETPTDDGAIVDAEVTENTEAKQESTPETDAEKEAEVKKPSGVQKRINELTRDKRELERKFEELQRQVTQPEKLYQPFQQPTLEQFQYDTEAYGQAMMQYAQAEAQRKYQISIEEDRKQRQHFEQQQYVRNIVEEHGKREKAFIKQTPDYADTVFPFMDAAGFREDILETIGLSDQSPAILYYLAQNPDEAFRIADLPPHHAGRSIALIEAKLASKTKPVSKAPDPAQTLKSAANTRKDLSDPSLSDEEWYALRKSQSR